MLRIILSIAVLLCAGTAAIAEPVSTGIAIISLFEATTGVAVGFEAAAAVGFVGNFIIGSALSVGLSFAAQALFGKPTGSGPIANTDSGVNTPEQRSSTRQSAPPKRIIYGEGVQVGGALFFEEVKPPYLYRGFLLADHEIAEVSAIYIGITKLSFIALTPNAILTPLAVEGVPAYEGRIQVSIRLGTDTQTIDPLLDRDFTNLDSSFRQQGIATVVVRYHYGTDWDEHQALWGVSGDPQTNFVVKGLSVYDPRDPLQDVNDETSWQPSNNATLCQNDYLRRDFGGRIPAAKIPYDRVALDADYDDDPVYCTDGTYIKRYTLDGLIQLNQSPLDTLTAMLSANRGSVVQSSGKVWVASSRPLTSVATVRDEILAGGLDYRNGKPKRDLVNLVQTRFIADEREYNLTDGPPISDPTQVSDDGETLVATLSLPFTRDNRRVQRIGKAYRDTSRLGRTLSVPVDLRLLAEAIDELPNNIITQESALFSMSNGDYRVNQLTFAENFATVQLDTAEYDASIETDWIAARDEQSFVLADLDVT